MSDQEFKDSMLEFKQAVPQRFDGIDDRPAGAVGNQDGPLARDVGGVGFGLD